MRKIPEQAWRLAIVFILFFGTLISIRLFVVPADLKTTGSHHTAAIQREKAKEIHFAGADACAECHPEIHDSLIDGHHRTLSCEVCHGANQAHVDAPDEVTPGAPRGRKFCPVCHAYSQSRPIGFPQIDPGTHNPRIPCIKCHDPHNPVPPQLIQGCRACHGKIARTKAVSPHADIECTVCHNTPAQHKVTPRTVKADKPQTRAFCGKCHSTQSKNPIAPKVDMATHGEKYVCWQCHYPHMPEVR